MGGDSATVVEAGGPGEPDEPGGPAARRRSRVWWWVAGGLALVVVAVATWLGESAGRHTVKAPPAFCKAAARLEHEFERHGRDRVDRQLQLVEQLAAAAPKRIEADMGVYLDAMHRVQTDKSVVDDPDTERAVDNVNRFASQGCGVFDRRGGI